MGIREISTEPDRTLRGRVVAAPSKRPLHNQHLQEVGVEWTLLFRGEDGLLYQVVVTDDTIDGEGGS